jgi:hypothetical protein
MKTISHDIDHAVIELEASEIGVLSDLLAQILGYEVTSSEPHDVDFLAEASRLYAAFTAALTKIWSEDESRRGPFVVGERVVRILDETGSRPKEPAEATIVIQHSADDDHDYDWSVIETLDHSQFEVPTDHLRRSVGPFDVTVD